MAIVREDRAVFQRADYCRKLCAFLGFVGRLTESPLQHSPVKALVNAVSPLSYTIRPNFSCPEQQAGEGTTVFQRADYCRKLCAFLGFVGRLTESPLQHSPVKALVNAVSPLSYTIRPNLSCPEQQAGEGTTVFQRADYCRKLCAFLGFVGRLTESPLQHSPVKALVNAVSTLSYAIRPNLSCPEQQAGEGTTVFQRADYCRKLCAFLGFVGRLTESPLQHSPVKALVNAVSTLSYTIRPNFSCPEQQAGEGTTVFQRADYCRKLCAFLGFVGRLTESPLQHSPVKALVNAVSPLSYTIGLNL